MSEFTDMTERVSATDSSLYLGRLVWYSITDAAYVNHIEWCRDLIEQGLLDHLPPSPRSSDVFKRACTATQKKRVPTDDPGKFMNILIREVGKDAQKVWRHVVVETVDTNGHSLDYSECASITFDRQAQSIAIEIINPCGERPEVQAVLAELQDQYRVWYNMLTPYAVRELIRKIIRTFGATALRDGVYFVKEEFADRIDALEAVVKALPEGSDFHSLPLIDDRKQRDMLRKSFEAESIGEIDRILGEITEINRSGRKITADRYADFKVEYDRLRKKAQDYSSLLDEAMSETGSRLEIMDSAIFGLMGSVKV